MQNRQRENHNDLTKKTQIQSRMDFLQISVYPFYACLHMGFSSFDCLLRLFIVGQLFFDAAANQVFINFSVNADFFFFSRYADRLIVLLRNTELYKSLVKDVGNGQNKSLWNLLLFFGNGQGLTQITCNKIFT